MPDLPDDRCSSCGGNRIDRGARGLGAGTAFVPPCPRRKGIIARRKLIRPDFARYPEELWTATDRLNYRSDDHAPSTGARNDVPRSRVRRIRHASSNAQTRSIR